MTPRQKRMATVAAILVGVGLQPRLHCRLREEHAVLLQPYANPRRRGAGHAQHPGRRARGERQRETRAGSLECASRSPISPTRVA